LLEDFFRRQRWAWQIFGSLFTIFALIALILASVGIYAVMAHAVGQKTQEIGVRMALGASTGSVVRMVMRSGAIQLVLGVVLGLAGAYGITRVLKGFLVQISPTDPATFIGIATVLALAGLAACLIPARRATRVDPVTALRYE
jgi:ABC-type antimicrobial peptide transport system permease subunit